MMVNVWSAASSLVVRVRGVSVSRVSIVKYESERVTVIRIECIE